LFTLGIGNYAEADVQAAARALTGWTVGGRRFRFASERHDESEITLLGHRGPLDGDELLAILVRQPQTARRVAWRLCTMFFGEDVIDDRAVEDLADELQGRDLNIGWAIEKILRSSLFFSNANLQSRVLGPVEFVMGSLHALDRCHPPPSTLLVSEWAAQMGQELFAPPNVGGWPEGRAWLGSRGIVARSNFAEALVEGRLWTTPTAPDLAQSVGIETEALDARETIEKMATLWWGEAPAGVIDQALEAVDAKPNAERLRAAFVVIASHPAAQLG
jgi:uncharacterized protein (DUF1800 family)